MATDVVFMIVGRSFLGFRIAMMPSATRRSCVVSGGKILALLAGFGFGESTCCGQLFRYMPPRSQRTEYQESVTSLPLRNLQVEKAEAEITVALQKLVSVELEKMPLDVFVAKFAQQSGVAVQIDHQT